MCLKLIYFLIYHLQSWEISLCCLKYKYQMITKFCLISVTNVCLLLFQNIHFTLTSKWFRLHIYIDIFFRKTVLCFIIVGTLDTIKRFVKYDRIQNKRQSKWTDIKFYSTCSHQTVFTFKNSRIVIFLLRFTTYLDVCIFKCVKYVRWYLFSCKTIFY